MLAGSVGRPFERQHDGQRVHDRGEPLRRQLRIGPFRAGKAVIIVRDR